MLTNKEFWGTEKNICGEKKITCVPLRRRFIQIDMRNNLILFATYIYREFFSFIFSLLSPSLLTYFDEIWIDFIGTWMQMKDVYFGCIIMCSYVIFIPGKKLLCVLCIQIIDNEYIQWNSFKISRFWIIYS